jgi:outer membrane protein assembly factor BamB
MIQAAWTAKLKAASDPKQADQGFALISLATNRLPEVVVLAADTGRVRWRAPASPSLVATGIGMTVTVAASGRIVVWMKPSGDYRAGMVDVVAADAMTGRRLWSVGRYGVTTNPLLCRAGKGICFTAYLGVPGNDPGSTIQLDARTGRVLLERRLHGAESNRAIGEQLHDTGGTLTRVNSQGVELWRKSTSEIFGGLPASPDNGWNIQRADGRYIAALGTAPPIRTVGQLADLSATAGFDAATGKTLWVEPHTDLSCGVLQFDVHHPVRCRQRGVEKIDRGGKPQFRGLDVTVEGFDPATGKVTWRWRAGAVEALVLEG